jgi:undecaprenyl-diphosphatase
MDNDFYSDGVVYDFVYKYVIRDGITPLIKFITWFGSTVGIVFMCIISMIVIRNKKINSSLTVCLILGTIINNIVKIFFARARPDINPLMVETTYSFPSGHSMMSIIFYGYLIYLVYNYLRDKKVKLVFISILSILIFCIGFSRIYLGVHYFSDVIGGFVLGIAYLIMYVEIVKKIIKKI